MHASNSAQQEPDPRVGREGEQRWYSTLGLRTALSWLLGLEAVTSLLVIIAIGNRLSVIDRAQAGTASFTEAQDADDFVTAASVVFVAVAIAVLVTMIVWQWRSAKNAEALGRVDLRLTPGWSIGGWFIPVANFVIPVRVMQDLWQSGDPDATRRTPWQALRRSTLVGWWWALFLAGALIARTNNGDGSTLDEIRTSNQIALASQVCFAAAAVLAIFVVQSITRRQEAARPVSPTTDWRPEDAEPTQQS